MKVYQVLAQLVGALHRCEASGNTEWIRKHRERIESLVMKHFPSGSGFDVGTGLNEDKSTEEKLVFHTSYHHMKDVGYYDGWTDHKINVTPSLAFDFRIAVTGRDRNDIKNHIGECFQFSLSSEVSEDELGMVARG
jgi:hypothetical protein